MGKAKRPRHTKAAGKETRKTMVAGRGHQLPLDGKHDLGQSTHWHNLSQYHVLGTTKFIIDRSLRFHLVIDHGISVEALKTKGQLGRAHLLAHAVLAHPDLRELLKLPKDWGK